MLSLISTFKVQNIELIKINLTQAAKEVFFSRVRSGDLMCCSERETKKIRHVHLADKTAWRTPRTAKEKFPFLIFPASQAKEEKIYAIN